MSLIGARGGVLGAAGVAAGGSSYLIEENFEGSGSPSGWTVEVDNGGVNWDYTDTVLRGSQSLSLYPTNWWDPVQVQKTFTGSSTIWTFFRFRTNSISDGDNQIIFRIVNSSATTIAELLIRNTGAWRIVHGSAAEAGQTPVADTTYFIWVRYTAGTGTNGVMRAYIGTTNERPTDPTLSITDGTSTADAAGIRLVRVGAQNGQRFIFDQVLVDTSEITNVAS